MRRQNTGISFKRFLLMIFIIIPSFAVNAENLNLEEYLARALRESPLMKKLNISREAAHVNREIATSFLFPTVSIDGSLPDYSSSTSRGQRYFGEAYQKLERENYSYSGSFNIEQLLPTNGTLTLSSNTNKSVFKQRSGIFSNEFNNASTGFSVKLNQPLFQNNDFLMNLKQARLEYDRAALNNTGELEQVIYTLIKAYCDHFLQEQKVALAIEQMDEISKRKDIAEDKFQKGILPKMDLLTLKVDFLNKQVDLMEQEEQLDDKKRELLLHLTLKSGDEEESLLTFHDSLSVEQVSLELETLKKLTRQNRQEFKDYEISHKINLLNLDKTKSQNRIKTAFSGNLGFNQEGDYLKDLGGGFGLNNWSVGLSFSIPVWDGGESSAKVEKIKLDLLSSEIDFLVKEKEIFKEVESLYSRLKKSETRVNILKENLGIATENRDMARDKYSKGLINFVELKQAEIAFTETKIGFLEAQVNQKLLLFELKKAAGIPILEPIPEDAASEGGSND